MIDAAALIRLVVPAGGRLQALAELVAALPGSFPASGSGYEGSTTSNPLKQVR